MFCLLACCGLLVLMLLCDCRFVVFGLLGLLVLMFACEYGLLLCLVCVGDVGCWFVDLSFCLYCFGLLLLFNSIVGFYSFAVRFSLGWCLL